MPPVRAAVLLALTTCLLSLCTAGHAGIACGGGNCPLLTPAAESVQRAVVRVVVCGTAGSRCYGSGTLIHKDDKRGIVLTCGHLFRGQLGSVVVIFPDGRRFDARLLGVDQAWDLAALGIGPPQTAPVVIAGEHPQPGAWLQSCGYGPDGRYWCNLGRALGYARTSAAGTYEILQLSGYAREGDSGGPVFNQQGELVAVVWGTDGRTVGGTYCGRIRKFLARIVGRDPGVCQPAQGPDARAEPGSVAPLVPVKPPAVAEDPQPQTLAGDGQRNQIAQIHRRIDELAGQVSQQAAGSRQQAERIQAVEKVVALVQGKTESVTDRETLRETIRQTVRPLIVDRGPDALAAVMPWILASLGLGGATPAVLVVWGMVRLLRKKVRLAATGTDAGQGQTQNSNGREPVVVPHDTSPPQMVERNRQFVPYQIPSKRLTALQWAHDEYVRRYPGGRSAIETIESYADQYQSGMKTEATKHE